MANAENLASEFTGVVDSMLETHADSMRQSTALGLTGDEVAIRGLVYHRGTLPSWRESGPTWGGIKEPFDADEAVWKIIPKTELGRGKESRMQLAVGGNHRGRIFRILDQTIGSENDLISTHNLTSSRELDAEETGQLVAVLHGAVIKAKDIERFRKMSPSESSRRARYQGDWREHYQRELQDKATLKYRGRSRRKSLRRARAAS